MGKTNAAGLSIFNYPVATKQLLFKLLDMLPVEPPWVTGKRLMYDELERKYVSQSGTHTALTHREKDTYFLIQYTYIKSQGKQQRQDQNKLKSIELLQNRN